MSIRLVHGIGSLLGMVRDNLARIETGLSLQALWQCGIIRKHHRFSLLAVQHCLYYFVLLCEHVGLRCAEQLLLLIRETRKARCRRLQILLATLNDEIFHLS